MSLIDGFFDNVEGIFAWVSTMLKQNALSYLDLEGADSKKTLATKDGSLVTIIRLEGYKRFVGPSEFVFLTERLTEVFQPVFSNSGHFVQFLFNYDDSQIKQSIDEVQETARQTAKRLGLNIDDIFDSRIDTLANFCADEDCFIALWTTPNVLDKAHLKQVFKDEKAKIKEYKLPRFSSVDLFAVLPEIRNIHESFINTAFEDIQHAGFYAQILDVHKAVYEVRKLLDPNYTDRAWKPYLAGDKLPIRFEEHKTVDISNLLWPPLDQQIFPRDAEIKDLKTVRIGDLIYAPVYIELFPKDIKPFYELFRRLLPAHMPWRISYLMGPDGIAITQSKNALAQFLTFSSHHNRLITETHRMLKSLHERSDNPIITLAVCLTTWAPEGKDDLLLERVAKLIKVVQSWGSCEVRQISGDGFGLAMNTALATTRRVYCSASAAPLNEAVSMLPFVRPASPWQRGAMLFRTPDGKIWPFQPGSNHQISWIDIVYARSGSGKSVLLSSLNLGLCLSAGLSNLPRISIIDIGPSSKGFISLLREGLPEEKKHEALYYRLTLEDKDSINPFDTQLGSRFPSRIHRSFLINFISLLLVDNIEDRPFEGMTSMLSMIVDETFTRYSDNEQPKVFVTGSEPEVDKRLRQFKHGLDLDHCTWWDVTDALYEDGDRHMALKAQRHAMPTIADTISIAHTHSIKDLFSEVKTPTGEDYIASYGRVISAVIRNFPTLTAITRLNIEDSRIVALDLDEVAKAGSAAADKQTAVMYMLSRHLLAQHFFLHIDEVNKFPPLYQPYHRERVKEIMEEPKRMVFDEFHRTSKSPVVRDQVLQDMREGRKWKIHVGLASQSLKDFDPLMIEFATSIFILDSGSQVSIEETCKTFGLSDTERLALSTRVHGPTSRGATFIAQFVTKSGMNTQLLTSTISPVELWAFNTTTEDVSLRDALYEIIGPVAARRMLSTRFPKGTAMEDIETELRTNPLATVGLIVDELVKEMTTAYRREERRKNAGKIGEGFL